MTGLGVLYATEATKEREWSSIPDRDKTGRLREAYWAHSAASKLKTGRKPFVSMTLNWWADRTEFGRKRDHPGDGFIYLVNMTSQRVEDRFEWLEVTEVFTTVPASHGSKARCGHGTASLTSALWILTNSERACGGDARREWNRGWPLTR